MDVVNGARGAQKIARVARVESLLAALTLAEKVGQMTQYTLPERVPEGPDFERTLDAVRAGQVGSFLNAPNLEVRNQLQRAALEESRLKIPLVFGRDVIHGYKTVFPIPLGLAASFDPGLAERVAAVAAREASEAGIDWTFAPMVDVTREPRWGRVAEGFGEDPLLASRLGVAMVRGFQGQNLAEPGRVAACAKHYVAYGASEAGKEYNTTNVPERLLRDLYLPPFQACVDAGVATVMCGFNDLDGVPMSGNRWAIRDLLKSELGFGGFVVSDWTSVHELIQHGLCADDRQAALQAALAGVDMEMVSKAYQLELARLVESGAVPLADVDEAVRRILQVKHRLGLFDQPYTPLAAPSVSLSQPHLDLARQAVRASLVLLQNEANLLPLSPAVRSVAVIGPLADDPHNPLGCWALDGDRNASVTVLSALRSRLEPGARVIYAPGVAELRSSETSGFGAALAAVQAADVAVLVLGEESNVSGECRSRAFLDLPGAQGALLEYVAAAGTPLVVIVMAGRPLVLGPVRQHAQALLYAWHPGTMAGPGIVDVLFGAAPAAGKLPISFPRAVGQVPVYYNAKNTGRPQLGEFRGVPTGTPLDPVDMTASFLDVEVTPEYPFGFGLAYTTFEYSQLTVLPPRVGPADSIEVSVWLTNTGQRAGVEIAQLYVRDRVGSVTRPVRELKGFERVELRPNESKRVVFRLGASDLVFCGRDLRVRAEPGTFDVYVGGDSRASSRGVFELVEE